MIINASFDHFNFHKKCVSQLIYLINISVIKIQNTVRMFLARMYVGRLRVALRKKKGLHRKNVKKKAKNTTFRRHFSVEKDITSDDEHTIATEYSRSGLSLGGSLDGSSVESVRTEHSYTSLSSEESPLALRTSAVDSKPTGSLLRGRPPREQNSGPLHRTAPSPLRGRAKKRIKKSSQVAQHGPRGTTYREMQIFRNEIGNVLVGFQEELKGVKQSIGEVAKIRPVHLSAAGRNNMLNEVSHICESEIQPVKEMMAMVLKEINSLKGSGNAAGVTPASHAPNGDVDFSHYFNADVSTLTTQMIHQLQVTEQQKSSIQSRELKSENRLAVNLLHESDIKAYKEEVAMLRKSEAEKAKRIELLSQQIRNSSITAAAKQRESYNEMMTAKASLQQANEELEARKMTQKLVEDEVIRLKHVIATRSNSRIEQTVQWEHEEVLGQLQREKGRVAELEREKEMLVVEHNQALKSIVTRLNESLEENHRLVSTQEQRSADIEALKSALQEVTARAVASDEKILHLEDELRVTKLENEKLVHVENKKQKESLAEKQFNKKVMVWSGSNTIK